MTRKVMLSWSSGKDSAWTLWQLQNDPDYELVGLFTTVNRSFDRVAMHAVRTELLRQQASHAGCPLYEIDIPYPCSNEIYQHKMQKFIGKAKKHEVDCFAFGDLFLEDVREYRIENLKDTGIDAIFPLWGLDTEQLANEMIKSGVKTVITCIDPKQIDKKFAGREFDQSFIDELPETADPCGENGEFHSFVYAGPMLKGQINITLGDVVERDGFVFADIVFVD